MAGRRRDGRSIAYAISNYSDVIVEQWAKQCGLWDCFTCNPYCVYLFDRLSIIIFYRQGKITNSRGIATTRFWQKWWFSAPQTHLWLIKIWFSASTPQYGILKITTFAKTETIVRHIRKKTNEL
jgi:hypothetical protein